MGCDLCGYSGDLFTAQVEGSLMTVCKKCLKFGNLIEKKRDFNVERLAPKKAKEESIVLLRDNYNVIIKQFREKLKLTQEELANQLNEKVSLIHKIENKDIEPNENIIKKLENFFKIKLTDEYKEENIKLDFKSSSLTIGDLLKVKREKN